MCCITLWLCLLIILIILFLYASYNIVKDIHNWVKVCGTLFQPPTSLPPLLFPIYNNWYQSLVTGSSFEFCMPRQVTLGGDSWQWASIPCRVCDMA